VLGLNCALIALLAGLFLSRSRWLKLFRSISRRQAIHLTTVLAITIGTAALVAPRTNRIFYDEQIYQGIGQHIARKGTSFMCNDCDLRWGDYRPFSEEYNKQPNSYPHYLSLFYQLLGVRPWVAHFANNLALLLGALCVYGIALALTGTPGVALIGSILFGATPMNLIWSNTAAAEPHATAFATLAILSAILFSKRISLTSGLCAAGACALAFQSRPESLLLTVPIGLVFLLTPSTEPPRKRAAAFAVWALCLGLLLLPHFAHLYLVRSQNWGSTDAKFSLTSFWQNISVNGPFYFNNERYPALFTLLAFAGMLGRRNWRFTLPLLAWALCLWGVFLFFYAGSYDYGADVRYSLLSAAPLAILGGIGGHDLYSKLARRLESRNSAFLLGLALTLAWIKFLPLIRTVSAEANEARTDVRIAREFRTNIPETAMVLTHNPTMWQLWGLSAAQASMATGNPDYLQTLLKVRHPDGVYFHWNFWCNTTDEMRQQVCDPILAQNQTETVREHWENGKRYALIRILSTKPRSNR
jgi:hypothetical protein